MEHFAPAADRINPEEEEEVAGTRFAAAPVDEVTDEDESSAAARVSSPEELSRDSGGLSEYE